MLSSHRPYYCFMIQCSMFDMCIDVDLHCLKCLVVINYSDAIEKFVLQYCIKVITEWFLDCKGLTTYLYSLYSIVYHLWVLSKPCFLPSCLFVLCIHFHISSFLFFFAVEEKSFCIISLCT